MATHSPSVVSLPGLHLLLEERFLWNVTISMNLCQLLPRTALFHGSLSQKKCVQCIMEEVFSDICRFLVLGFFFQTLCR